MYKILVTCPPMLGVIEKFRPFFERHELDITAPQVVQTMAVRDLMQEVPLHDGWIIGDDYVNREVLMAGRAGRLRAAVKWGIGVDNIDFEACHELGIPISNTPDVFGADVADIALGYLIALARETFQIDDGVRRGEWPKPQGISLTGKTVALLGLGNVGKNLLARLEVLGMRCIGYDPFTEIRDGGPFFRQQPWPEGLEEADFLIISCSLTAGSRHLVNSHSFSKAKYGLRLVNVSRGAVIDEQALEDALRAGKVYSAALDVFEVEPLPQRSFLLEHPLCILGSHNASNTHESVVRASEVALTKLLDFLNET